MVARDDLASLHLAHPAYRGLLSDVLMGDNRIHDPNSRIDYSGEGVWTSFGMKEGLGDSATLVDVVEAIRSLPYGRPRELTPTGVVSDWRGTCSTKHALLSELTSTRWPELEPLIVHRVYRLTPELARTLFGEKAAAVVPSEGLIDVHTYMTALIEGRRVKVDATVSGRDWDGRSDMDLACGHGVDIDGGEDPWATKSALVQEHCNRHLRDRVIEALSAAPAPGVSASVSLLPNQISEEPLE